MCCKAIKLGNARVFPVTTDPSLPVDPSAENRTRQVFGACFSRVSPTPVKGPRTLAVARDVAELLELPADFVASQDFAEVFSGNRLLPGMEAVSACYGGHQFGNWAGQLGDGRAITLGELATSRGEHWELQLKGAGPTPYSRRADGRAVMRSSVREFLCSEAMHHLGIPTTRALSLVGTGEGVLRDILYDGHPREEPGAVVCRVAPSFLRFGNFEIFASRGDVTVLRALADYTIRTYFPELGEPSKDVYVAWLKEVARRTATTVAKWMGVGFVHGVMNTDNMSILGLTIDYGPYGFLDDFAPDWTPNITDAQGRRYRYASQPRVALWNIVCLANAIYPLVEDVDALEQIIPVYTEALDDARARIVADKLGLSRLNDDEQTADGGPRIPDATLVDDLIELLAAVETDMTLFYRHLADVPAAATDATDASLLAPLEVAFYDAAAVDAEHRARLLAWLRRYTARVREDGTTDAERKGRMNLVNPKFVLRNYVAQLAIDAAEKADG
ncbi:protein adenylyltransferase SelO, partial [Escherichia coli]|uniref:protein adenylyltransferase SelO n=3 Tax=Escherichia coli TaxID=562 RepID=UPI00128EC42E